MLNPCGKRTWRLLFAAATLACLGVFSARAQAIPPIAGSSLSQAPSAVLAGSGHPPPRATRRADEADQLIRFWQGQVARDPTYWISLDRLASAYSLKARETGDISYFQLAEASLDQSLKLESTHSAAAPAFTEMATVHLAEHRFREAGEDAEKAIALDPGELSPYPYAGDAQLEQGNYVEAKRFYDRLADPGDGKPHAGLRFLAASHGATLYWIKGDVPRACDDLRASIALAQELHLPAENVAWTEFMLGEQMFQSGDLAGAEQQETAALAHYPQYHRALAAMGQIRAAQGRLPEAIAFYKQAVDLIPLPIYAAALGDVYVVSGRRAEAEKQYALVEFIGKLSAINQQVFNRELALFYADHDRKLPEALRLADKELQVRHDVYTEDALAWALLKNGQVARARQEMQQALRMGTKDALLEYHAGMIAVAAADDANARLHLERALAINPHFHVIFAARAAETLAALDGARPAGVASVSKAGTQTQAATSTTAPRVTDDRR